MAISYGFFSPSVPFTLNNRISPFLGLSESGFCSYLSVTKRASCSSIEADAADVSPRVSRVSGYSSYLIGLSLFINPDL